MADLLSVLHQIDEMRGRICATCVFNRWRSQRGMQAVFCQKGHDPCDRWDGCDDHHFSPGKRKQAVA